MIHDQLLSKQGEVIMKMSRILLLLEKKDTIPTNQVLANQLKAGAGTIQSALKYFEEAGALTLESHGHQGTVVEEIDYVKLFNLSPTPWITGEMPLLYSAALEGLATGLYENFDDAGVLLKLSYVRGGKARIDYLKEGKMDFAVCSKMAAQAALSSYDDLELLAEFGPKTYVSLSGIIFSRKGQTEIEDGMRLGVDEDSVDHVNLNKLAAGSKDVKFVRLKYSQILPKLVKGEIDATVWSFDNIRNAGIENCSMIPAAGELEKSISPAEDAAILVKKDSPAKNVIKAVLNIKKISKIQKDVIEQKLIPSY